MAPRSTRAAFILASGVWLLASAAPAPGFEKVFQAGLQALNNNDLGAAQSNLETASRLQPENAHVWLALSQVYFKENRSEPAARAAVKAEALGSGDPIVLQGLVFYYAEARRPAKAGALEARYAAKSPQDSGAYLRAIDLYLRAGQPKPALALASAAQARNDSPPLHELLAKAYDLDDQFPKAIAEHRRAVELRPYDEGYVFEFAQCYLRRQKFAEALEILQPARQRFDRSAQIELAAGVALYGLRRFPETIDAFLKTIRLDPDVDQPYIFLGRMIDQAEAKMPEVSGALATYVSVKPNSYMSNFLYAKALIAQNADTIQVEPLLRKSIALNGRFWESHFELGGALEKDRDFAGARLEYLKAIALNPKDASTHYRLARVCDRLGKPQEAAAERALHAKLSATPQASVQAAPPTVLK